MTAQQHGLQPPSSAVWLLDLFTPAEKAESIQGDLLEEFLSLVPKSGVSSARGWYWRQTIRTVLQLVSVSFITAPWMTAMPMIGGLLLQRLFGPLIEPAMFSMLERYQVFEHHFSTYNFLASTGIDIGHLITFLLIGFAVGFASKQREMVTTITLALIHLAMVVAGSIYVVSTGSDAHLWRLTWYFADCFVIVAAGAIVRMHRLALISRPPHV